MWKRTGSRLDLTLPWCVSYLLKDTRVVDLHLGLGAGGLEVWELGGVLTDITGHLAASRPGAHTGEVSLSICPGLGGWNHYINVRHTHTHTPTPPSHDFILFIHTDSLSEAEERRDLTVLVRCKRSPMSDVWLVTVDRRVDMKLLLVDCRSRLRTHSKNPRHGMYLAMAILKTKSAGCRFRRCRSRG